MTNGKESSIIYAFSIGIPALIAFHEYSTYLSSPWTTQKLNSGGEDESSLWQLFFEATAASLLWTGAVGATLAWGLHDWKPLGVSLLSAGLVAIWIGWDYKRALDGEL
jgi:hypothetical protein